MKRSFIIISFLLYSVTTILFSPSFAYAYLDPASGSALVTTIVAFASASLFALKNVYYKVFARKSAKYDLHLTRLPILFSEGKSYWGTFEPIVKEFITRKKHFRYITLDVSDPALTIESEYMHAKLYSKSSYSFGKLSLLQGPLLLATTPNIGCKDYPMSRPKGVKEMLHVFHHLTDSSPYRLGSLDYFDSVITVGDYQEKYLRHVEVMRNIKKKEVLPLGLPYFDNLYNELQSFTQNNLQRANEYKTILIAPSWGNKSCFNYFGINFVKELAKEDIEIIIRLHPHSFIYEPEKVRVWIEELSVYPNITWDKERLSTSAMWKASLLISDTSSVRFDFALLHLKPVITLDIPQENMEEFESRYHEVTWSVATEAKLGAVVNENNILSLTSTAMNLLDTFNSKHLLLLRNETVANLGYSSVAIVDYIEKKTNFFSHTKV